MGWIVLAAAVAGAGPVVLQPELRPGRSVHGRSVLRNVHEEPGYPDDPIVMRVTREATAADSVVLTMRTPLPESFAWVHSELWMQYRVRYGSDGAVAESEVLVNDLGPLLAWLGLPDLGGALPSDLVSIVANGCSPLGYQALLPSAPAEVGEVWTVGEVRCELVSVEGAKATVKCASEQHHDDSWAVYTQTEERTLTVDLAQRIVSDCQSTRANRREIDPDRVQVWREEERYEAAVGDPLVLGTSLPTKGGVLLAAALATLVGLGVWVISRWRR